MIADLKPYPAYKESGLPWLGKVPEHWDVKRAKSIFECVDVRSNTGKEELLTVSSTFGVIPRKTATVTMFKAESYVGYKLCWQGDLVINSLWAWAGGLGVSRYHGIISTAYGVYRIRKNAPMIPSFVNEVMRSSAFNWELQVRSKGIWISRLQLTDLSFLDAPVHIPPPDEQVAIVRFLGWANGQLEKAIRAKRKVITLLNEQKQVIIHRAVTRGLDPSIPLKPSGIPWLGDIPEHWEVRPIKTLLRETDRRSSDGADTLLSLTRNRGLIPHSEMTDKMHSAQTLVGYKQYNPGQIVMNRMQAWSGMFGSGAVFGLVSPDYAVFDIIGKHEVGFVLARLKAKDLVSQFVIASKGIGSGFNRLYTDRFGPIRITIPPINEQYSIVAYIDRETNGLNSAISRFEREIELLREYRTRLVADVVTGKLDVREAAAKLPDEVQTLEFEDDLVVLEEDVDCSL